MDPAIVDYLWIAVAALTVSSIGFAAAWLRARERAIRAEARPGAPPHGAAAGAQARFDRLDQAVEAIAVELERVAEAERFQSRLLASHAAPRPDAERVGR